ncbi:hypothetical protein BS47DRAFT_1306012 [Hydnum rufescens UP504]|uniref:Uncharacterized protein n=1 Tax=Hydnum rufescens UP504 TaxID=1448309 RepID=A0A9P6AHN7_9AGAM|nr:hypothetical protein BS47DRAFT_1306012 [Hydnum rufescens UP504]
MPGGKYPLSGSSPSSPENFPRTIQPDPNPSQGRMCVAVDFGAVLSGVACGQSLDKVQQILWPGPHRRVPTSLVYDAQGRVVAWGHKSHVVELERGWIRCEMFKPWLYLNGALDHFPSMFPVRVTHFNISKGPIDVVTDYLRELWLNAKPRILKRGYTKEALQSADIWLPIPATWNVRTGEMMRDAAYAAGLVAPEGSQEYAGGRDRLHLISDLEAGAVHCVLWKDLRLKPNQSFMVCNAGSGIMDTAIYQILGNVTQILERCASSRASCGLHFLDIYFRAYLSEWHRNRNVRLSPENLARYMHAFTYSQKLEFNGKQDERHLYFECFDPSDYYSTDLPDDEFFQGQLMVPVNDLRERVFDPIVNEVLRLLEAQLKRGGSVDALLLVGEFSASPYLFDRIRDTFHGRMRGRILNPMDPDIAVSLGAVQAGLAGRLIPRPIGAPTVIAPKSYIIGIGPNVAISPGGNCSSGNPAGVMMDFNKVFEYYLVVKGALLKKGEPVLHEFTKTSSSPSDSVFVARIYSSDSAEVRTDTSGGDLEHLHDWEIDISHTSLFKHNAQNSPGNRFDTVFDIGIEIDSQGE